MDLLKAMNQYGLEDKTLTKITRLDDDLQELQQKALDRMHEALGEYNFPMSFVVLQQVLRELAQLKTQQATQNQLLVTITEQLDRIEKQTQPKPAPRRRTTTKKKTGAKK